MQFDEWERVSWTRASFGFESRVCAECVARTRVDSKNAPLPV